MSFVLNTMKIPFGNVSQVAACATSSTPTLRCHIVQGGRFDAELHSAVGFGDIHRLQALCSFSCQCVCLCLASGEIFPSLTSTPLMPLNLQLSLGWKDGCRLRRLDDQPSPDAAVTLSSRSFVCLPARESPPPRLPLRRRRAIVPLPTTRRRTPAASSDGIDFVSPVCERDEHAGTARAAPTELLVAESRTRG